MKKIIAIILCLGLFMSLVAFGEGEAEYETIVNDIEIANSSFEEPLNPDGSIPGWTVLAEAGEKVDPDGTLLDSDSPKYAYGPTTEKATVGEKSLRVYDGGATGYVQLVSNAFPVREGASYTFSFDALGKVLTSAPAYVSIKFTETEPATTTNGLVIRTYQGIDVASGFNATSFVSKSKTILPSGNATSGGEQIPTTAKFARVYIYTAANTRAHVLVDNIKVTETYKKVVTTDFTKTIANAQVNLENGDFEKPLNDDGTIPGWELLSTGTALPEAPSIGHDYAADGAGSIYVGQTQGYPVATPDNNVLNVYDKGAGGSVFLASAPMEIEKTGYKLTFDAIRFYQTPGTSHVVKVALKFTDTPDIITTAGLYAPEVVLGGSYADYKTATINVTAAQVPATAKYVRIYVFAIESGGGHAYVDNFKLTKSESVFRVRTPELTDDNGSVLNNLPESGILNMSFQVDDKNVYVPLTFLVALLNEDGEQMEIYSSADFENAGKGKQLIELSFEITKSYSELQVMAFEFKDGKMNPYYTKKIPKTITVDDTSLNTSDI